MASAWPCQRLADPYATRSPQHKIYMYCLVSKQAANMPELANASKPPVCTWWALHVQATTRSSNTQGNISFKDVNSLVSSHERAVFISVRLAMMCACARILTYPYFTTSEPSAECILPPGAAAFTSSEARIRLHSANSYQVIIVTFSFVSSRILKCALCRGMALKFRQSFGLFLFS
jgi:hypothetical protein